MRLQKGRRDKITIRDVLYTLAGTLLYALGVYVFTAPNQIAPGGVSGFVTILNHLIGAPIGIVTAAINLPLIVLGWFYLGHPFILKTLISVAGFAVFYDYTFVPLHFPQYEGDYLLAALFGGALIGIGLGITFLGESSTGGLDISSMVIQKKYPYIKISSLVFFFDLIIIAFGAVAYQTIESALYALVAMFVQTKFIDVVLYGADMGKMVTIVTGKGDEVAGRILKEMERGVTKIESIGAYSGERKQTLLCAVRQNEYHKLQRIVYETDPGAFMIVSTATEVLGDGFKISEHIQK